MKKLLILSIFALSLAACNNSAEGPEEMKDSALNAIDSTKEAAKDSVEQKYDSLEKKIEASYEATDSANKAIADSTVKAKQ